MRIILDETQEEMAIQLNASSVPAPKATVCLEGWYASGMTVEDAFRAGAHRAIEAANRVLCTQTSA